MRSSAPRVFLETRYVLKSIRDSRRQVVLYLLALALVFVAIGVVQHVYVRFKVERTVDQELVGWATQVSAEIAYRDKWDLEDYRQRAAIYAPRWYIVASDGLIVDIEGLFPGVFGRVEPITESIVGSPQTVVSSIGESWRLLGKRIDGGLALVGMASPKDIAGADKTLAANLAQFGSNLRQAASVRERQIDQDVDFAVLNSAGVLVNASGGVPLKTDIRKLPTVFDRSSSATITGDGHAIRLVSEPIRDTQGQPVGVVIVPKDLTLDLHALTDQDRFNALVVTASLALTVALALAFTVRELLRQQNTLTVQEALKVGESKTVEFKSTYRWDPDQGKDVPDRRLVVLKSIAGFLNADGGTLYIGVGEDRSGRPTVCGLKNDLEIMGGNIDKLRRDLTHLTAARIGTQFAPCIADRIDRVQDELCWVVTAKRAPEPAFVRWHDSKKFYVREGPRTADLDNESTYRYIKNRWR